MNKKKQLFNLRAKITDNAVKIKYLLENAIYKPDSERESFIMTEIAIYFVKEIKINSEKIGKIIKH